MTDPINLIERKKRQRGSQACKNVDSWNRTNTSVLNADYIIERVKHQV
ncbi:hypothetical protein [Enterococcus devriesei]